MENDKRELKEFAGYYATSDGHIINRFGRVLREHAQRGVLPCVTIGIKGKVYTRSVARLVAEAWLGLPTGGKRLGYAVAHIDGDPLNNSVENLYYEKKLPVWLLQK